VLRIGFALSNLRVNVWLSRELIRELVSLLRFLLVTFDIEVHVRTGDEVQGCRRRDSRGVGRVRGEVDVSPRSCTSPAPIRRPPRGAEYTRSGFESGNTPYTSNAIPLIRSASQCRGRDSNLISPRSVHLSHS
jgi:hypothetical protein